MSLLVFKDASAMDVTVSRLNSQRTLCIHAFKNHISTQDVMPSGGGLEGITPTQFGSRINANELELFSKAHDFILQELARYIHIHTHTNAHTCTNTCTNTRMRGLPFFETFNTEMVRGSTALR